MSDYINVIFHFRLPSYLTELAEGAFTLTVNPELRTLSLCYICTVKIEKLPSCTAFEMQSVIQLQKPFKMVYNSEEKARGKNIIKLPLRELTATM